MSFDTPSPQLPTLPSAPAKPPMFGEQTQPGKKPKQKSMTPTFLGGEMTPQAGQLGQKSLLGGGAT